MTNQFDVILVGAGHNGLAAACYLAKAGYKVLALERRNIVGGAVVTESDIFPGFKLDTCSSFHVVIHGTPVVSELELEKFGLEYIDVDPWAFAPFPNGNYIIFYRDVDRTAETIARFSPHDAEAYRKFMRRWMKFNETIMEVFCTPPRISQVAKKIIPREIKHRGEFTRMGINPFMLRDILSPYGKVIERTFESPEVRGALAWLGAQSGPGPKEMASGELMAMQQSLYHMLGVRRPRGGSGMLTQAMARCLEHYGGEVQTCAEVKQLLVEQGIIKGVELDNGERFYAPVVVSNAHVQTTLLDLLPQGTLNSKFQNKVEKIKVSDGFGMTLRCTVNNLPNYNALPSVMVDGKVQAGEQHRGMQLLCPSIEYLQRTYDEAEKGLPPSKPAVIAMTPSVIDDTLAPKGNHAFYIWAQTHPYRLSNGEHWEDIREREAEKCLEVVEEYAPGFRKEVEGIYIKTPVDLERINGLLKGNLMHVDMSLKQMFFWRPFSQLANYRTPIKGLYLTGASTHPGGGVSAASGYNAAQVMLTDLHR
ncbi:MAG: NAD(P)/FAD-dependent oxidoreductase [Chloroflexi bacterium]|uniref:Pyridine nucleotide-disulfide oxidoreductase domain-containing protein 2 n=1 Tax=Candidatus Chlorohelix allophototropha TaxID=3003348 RepID=A0A8T7M6Y7_9CHLR|nr:NAD(P)/FAD-dependent oxidoreductase [Chloroflexota bacterium]WJW69748.1 NAD(P)/FAD-dependent oxidoreductase [Chloroflexota bacterium L227-S17]